MLLMTKPNYKTFENLKTLCFTVNFPLEDYLLVSNRRNMNKYTYEHAQHWSAKFFLNLLGLEVACQLLTY